MRVGMENRVDDFVAGVEVTFGHLAGSSEESAGFLEAARRFYLEYMGVGEASTSNQPDNQLPFWRYLIFYSTLGLDHAACRSDMDELEEHRLRELAGTLSSCWPLLGVLVSHTYTGAQPHYPAAPPQDPPTTLHGSRSLDDQASTRYSAIAEALHSRLTSQSTRPTLQRHASVAHARKSSIVESITPPIQYTAPESTFEPDEVPVNLPTSPGTPLWDRYLGRASGRSLSQATQLTTSSTSTYPYDILSTPPQHSEHTRFFTNEEVSYPTSIPMGHVEFDQRNLLLGLDKPEEALHDGFKLSVSRNLVSQMPERSTKLLLADRGDNTARLVPTADGSYILDVSIGGKKLIINPQHPNEIQYHDHQGFVVTESLRPNIPAQ